MKKYTITAALPYANGPLHLGHLAGAYLPADIYARFLRMLGRDVVFVCGSDEHGAAITIRAKKEGIVLRRLLINTTILINKPSKNWASLLISITEPVKKYTTKLLRNFF